ncbi:MAG: 4-(cytidine 5'-diphospho)-2-C-methyl-D-erythritol kinase, partial [Fibrobacteres bacterium]|nr:4-(cytidine 5'-diphospho)-2-C-methyl-D-erythritol kinase [Fibrobacterota bacterium]
IETIFTSVKLADTVKLSPLKEDRIVVKCSDPSIPSGPENIAYKAAEAVKKVFKVSKGIKISILKKIPAGAGMAGGSGNGAAVVRGCIKLWGIKASQVSIRKILAKLGSDVPYCYMGGTALGTGRGEKLKKLPPFTGYKVLVVNPRIHVSTPEAYRLLKRGLTATEQKVSLFIKYSHFLTNRLLLSRLLENDFEEVVCKKHPVIKKIKGELLKNGAEGALMSGSGSTVFGLFKGAEFARRAACSFSKKGYKVFLTELC